VAEKLQLEWSPEQIAGWLERRFPDDERCQVSPETIYRSLFIQARGALKKELLQHLRRTRGMRRSRHHTPKSDDHGRITDTVVERPRKTLNYETPAERFGQCVASVETAIQSGPRDKRKAPPKRGVWFAVAVAPANFRSAQRAS
jgi:IS30 family transposase